jgi:hypothetical protein
MSSTAHAFPLQTGGSFAGESTSDLGPDNSDGTEAGASGASPGAVQISKETMIAIIVVVVLVSVIGSMFTSSLESATSH